MIDQLISGIKEQIGANLGDINLPEGISTEAFSSAASSTLLENLQGSAGQGDFSGIMEMFSGSETPGDSPVLSNISPGVIQGIADKLGIDPSTIEGAVQKFLPSVMNMFNDKVSSGEGGFDIGGLIGQFTGGGGGGISDILSKLTGNNNQQGSGGLSDLVKGLF